MDWQQVVSLMIVAGAAGLLLWGKLRRRKFGSPHDAHLGCPAGPLAGEQCSIVFRARKGQRPEVVVKMK